MNRETSLWAGLMLLTVATAIGYGLLSGTMNAQQSALEDQGKIIAKYQDVIAKYQNVIDDMNRKVAALEIKFEICMLELRKTK